MIIRLAFASSEEWKVKSEKCWLKNASRFSSFPFLFSLLSLLSPNFVRLWSVWMDSNHRPRAYQARALTTWATNRSQVVPVPSSHGSLSGGGDDGIRTHDPLLAGQVLSQLSYTPIFPWALVFSKILQALACLILVNWTTKVPYSAYMLRSRHWLVWQIRENLSRSP